ncbi:Helicase with zinc finger domain 2 [Dissostichus eleginoides]|uniref:Helicase with zinc finger domain 2 n=1 Tax=Dissostichus eleginoides TaxID=100907 RepID=A0AAD9CI78_DISEL|nr:Helicase with zinc finger domain 2 [Dissostichus eleginoides]
MSAANLAPLTTKYDLKLVCTKCSVEEKEITYRLKPVQHQCAHNLLLCRAKCGSKWRPVSKRPTFPNPVRYEVCYFFKEGQGCSYHKNRCTFARSDEEADVWTFEKCHRINHVSLCNLVAQSEGGADPPDHSESLRDLPALDLKAVCDLCSVKENEISYTVQSVSHKCSRNLLLAKDKACDLWRPVSERPTCGGFGRNVFYEVCQFFVEGSGCKKHGQTCSYARSDEEATLWNYVKDKRIGREEFIRLVVESETISITPESTAESILQQFPGEFIELCKRCFNDKPQQLTTKRWTPSCSADAGHPWDPVLVHHLSENKRKHVYSQVRPLPENCPFEFCSHVTEGKPCWHQAGRCQAAHSEVEMAVWRVEHGGVSVRPYVLQLSRQQQAEQRLKEQLTEQQLTEQQLTEQLSEQLTEQRQAEQRQAEQRPVLMYCRVCLLLLSSPESFFEHCSSLEHARLLSEDTTTRWRGRQPPHNHRAEFWLCERPQTCEYGTKCPKAHSEEELKEWLMRAAEEKEIRQSIGDQGLMNYNLELLEEYKNSSNEVHILSEQVNDVSISCDGDLTVECEQINETLRWNFQVETERQLVHVALLKQEPGASYTLGDISSVPCIYSPGEPFLTDDMTYDITVSFTSINPGLYDQWLVLDFDMRPVLLKKLRVRVGKLSLDDVEQPTVTFGNTFQSAERWHRGNRVIIPCSTRTEEQEKLLKKYKPPQISFLYKSSYSSQTPLNSDNYKERMHQFLYDEERAEDQIVSRLNVCGEITTSETLNSTKFDMMAPWGELFCAVSIPCKLTPDTPEGLALKRSIQSALIAPLSESSQNSKVYEASILKDKTSENTMYLQLSKKCCSDLTLRTNELYKMEVQFQLNRHSFCTMHKAVDLLPDTKRVLPDLKHCGVPVNNIKHEKLNPKQQSAVDFITGSSNVQKYSAPLLIYGPFGTGKTFTLALAARELCKLPHNKVLICTHTNSSADLYVRDHFHPFTNKKDDGTRPIRIKNSRIIFSENYRSTKEIVEFVSTNFYVEEVVKVAEAVKEVLEQWPLTWGPKDPSSICILSDGCQVWQMRKALSKRGLNEVHVENLANVQGKQFRAVIMTAVQTRDSLKTSHLPGLELFNDARVLNTAMTRAQSQVVVVGDAAALCCFGNCSKVWKSYIDHCISNNSVTPKHFTKDFFMKDVMETTRFQKPEHVDESSTLSDAILQELKDDYELLKKEHNLDEDKWKCKDFNNHRSRSSYNISDVDADLLKYPGMCNGKLVREPYNKGYVVPFDNPTSRIRIKGRDNMGKTFTGDEVVLQTAKVISITKQSESARVLVCLLEDEDHSKPRQNSEDKFIKRTMIPIAKSAPKIRILISKRKRNCIPIWEKMNGNVIDILPIGSSLVDGLRILNEEFKVEPNTCNPDEGLFSQDEDGTHREDLSHMITFTVDPKEAKDLDDAISVREIGEHEYELGVHIADVASFVIPGCELDKEAEQRGTTYYSGSVDPVHMFPKELSTGTFSLLSDGKQRRVVSLMFKVNKKTNEIIGKHKLQLSGIKSNRQLSYDEAEAIITDRYREGPAFDSVEDCVTVAYRFAKARRKDRLGSDWAYSQPDDKRLPGKRKANMMVEELSVLFNTLASKDLIDSKKTLDCTPLRCQSKPDCEKIEDFKAKYGELIPLSFHVRHKVEGVDEVGEQPSNCENIRILTEVWEDIQSAARADDIDKMVDLIAADDIHPPLQPVVDQFRKCFSKAKVICSNSHSREVFRHYSLNVDSYTQATSPIRRYMDLISQRLLHSIIHDRRAQYTTPEIATLCSQSEDNLKNAKEYEQKAEQISYARGDTLQIQMTTEVRRGYNSPAVQLVRIKPRFEICVDHVHSAITCFAKYAEEPSKILYRDTNEYVQIWKPLCKMESASTAVDDSDSIVIENLVVNFRQKQEGSLTGSFFLPIACITEWAIECNLSKCLLCIRKRGLTLPSTPEHSALADPRVFTWVAHGVTVKAEPKKPPNEGSEVEFYVHHLPMENIPDCVFQKNTFFTVEIIPKSLPDIRKEEAVENIPYACDLVKAIALGKHIPKEVKSMWNHQRKELPYGLPQFNPSQHLAVEKALNNTFTIIQGPPGTGKTVVGVKIVFGFFELNAKSPRTNVDPRDENKKQVILYCGPSNKSVDVVAEYLLRFGDRLRPLRFYSQHVEMLDYPYPDCALQFSRRSIRQEHAKPELRSITLHHRMREDTNPFSGQIKDFDLRILEKGKKLPAEAVKEYKRLLVKARKYEFERHDIILCTCSQSSTPNLTKTVSARQILIDECAMATEPQALIPLVCNRPEKIVLIGDHKQLRPIVNNVPVRRLGMAKSLFERYHTMHKKSAVMLDTQYRMHKEICKFPSQEFYEGNLLTGVEQPSSVLRVDNKTMPIVFGDIRGKTVSLVVNTAKGNENSKANEEERIKVIDIAEKLVTKANIKQQNIVILSPYNAQVSEIRDGLKKKKLDEITATTITKSQGSEWSYVIISTVCSLPSEEIEAEQDGWLSRHLGFVADPNQINVGITRAKEGLCIIGNQELLNCSRTWKKLLDHFKLHNAVTDADKISVLAST